MNLAVFLLQKFADVPITACDANSTNQDCANIPTISANGDQITRILQTVFGVIGVVAVVIIIYAGFQLMVSLGGNPEAMSKARKTIIYAAIGLLIAISAEFIVSFVLNKI